MTVRLTEVVEDVKALPRRRRFAIGAGIFALTLGLGWLIQKLAGDAVIGSINDFLVATFGPVLPAVFELLTAYAASVIAASGLLWFAFSIGYWAGTRDPRSLASNQTPATAGQSIEADKAGTARRRALGATKSILHSLEVATTEARRGWGDGAFRAFEERRPDMETDLHLIREAGFPVPNFTKFDRAEAPLIAQYAREILPFLEKNLMGPGAQRALEQTNEINASLSDEAS